MSESVDELVRLSRYCGLRFDLTQAAGGNISVKCGPHMLIKSSGFHLADVDAAQGYSIVDNQRLQADLSAGIATSLEPYVQFSSKRPSIETFMHASLGRFTVHLHPIQVNAVLTAQGAREKLSRIWPDSHIVDYVRPGIDLAIAVQSNGASEQVTFLLNHGVIFSTQDAAAILPLIEKTLARFTEFAIIDSAQHQRVNPISNLLERLLGEACAVYLCEDAQIRAHFDGLNDLRATFPDAVVYCGTQVLRMAKVDETNMQRHIETFGMPKLIVVDNSLYIADLSLKKCRDVEAVLKSLLLLQDPLQPRALLSDVEVSFLNQWDAEKYRRELKH
jgi:rhamnose utilization protein RhaD (predicted bifunctional aldolase and dehydrogenase)